MRVTEESTLTNETREGGVPYTNLTESTLKILYQSQFFAADDEKKINEFSFTPSQSI